MYHIVICDDEPIFFNADIRMIIDYFSIHGRILRDSKIYFYFRIKKYIAEYSQKL